MAVSKRIHTLIYAALALTLLTACGRSKPANEPVSNVPAASVGSKAVDRTTEQQPIVAPQAQAGVCPVYDGQDVRDTHVPTSGWKSELVECAYGQAASDAIVRELYVIEGERPPRRIAGGLTGRFVPLANVEAVFVCEDNLAMSATRPLLARVSGDPISLPEHAGTVSSCRAVGNGRQILLQYADSEAGIPFAVVRVFDEDGALLVERRFDDAGTIAFSV